MQAITHEYESPVKVNTVEEMEHWGGGVPGCMNAIVYNAYGAPDVLSRQEI